MLPESFPPGRPPSNIEPLFIGEVLKFGVSLTSSTQDLPDDCPLGLRGSYRGFIVCSRTLRFDWRVITLKAVSYASDQGAGQFPQTPETCHHSLKDGHFYSYLPVLNYCFLYLLLYQASSATQSLNLGHKG